MPEQVQNIMQENSPHKQENGDQEADMLLSY
jgi:hypothetical protein